MRNTAEKIRAVSPEGTEWAKELEPDYLSYLEED